MDHQNSILTQIKPCNISKPYIFVSYSSSDWETVWTDVLRFQCDGYNVWLDEKNLDKTKNSWKEDALRAINSRRCQLVLFYVSATSLCSEPCLGELRETRSERTLTNHLDPLSFVAIDVEPIGNIIDFCRQVHMRLDDEIEDEKEFERKAQALKDLRTEFFSGNNDRVRVHPRNETNRKGDYYEDIEHSFPDKTRLNPPEPSVAPPVSEPVIPDPPISEPPVSEPPVSEPSVSGPAVPTTEGSHESGAGPVDEPKKEKRLFSATGDITYTLYGVEHTGSQAEMMWNFFREVLRRHPEQVQGLPEQQGMNCASAVNYADPQNKGAGMPSYFKACRFFTFPGGESVCIGTAYNNTDKLKKMALLLSICGEDPSIFSSKQVELPDLSAPRRKGGRPRKTAGPDSAV